MKMMKCKKENLMTSHFSTLYKWYQSDLTHQFNGTERKLRFTHVTSDTLKIACKNSLTSALTACIMSNPSSVSVENSSSFRKPEIVGFQSF